MKALIRSLIGLVVSVSASAEPLLEGRVRLESGEPVVDAQVKLFDMADLQRGAVVRATTDETGYFALPLAALTGSARPKSFTLGQNYPNPFNPSTIIPYQLAASSPVRLEVFNLLGQRIATLVDGERPAGFHTASWNATDAAGRAVGAGIYIYRMTVGMERQSGRMVLIDGQAGVSAAGAASGLSDASKGDGPTGEESEVYGLSVSGSGLAPYMDTEFRVRAGMAPVELVVAAALQPASKVADPDALVDIPDANLRRLIEAYLGKDIDAPITVADMEALTEIEVLEAANISDLTGLEFAANLTVLFLVGNAIADVSPLSSLTNLTRLQLVGNVIEDVSPLSSLTNLTGLDLSYNRITDVSSLSSLTNLIWLILRDNRITDVSSLSSLTNLTVLYLQGNAIEDVSPLSGLTNLTQLYLQGNPITDFSPLAGLTNLERLDFVLEEEGTGEPVTIPDAHLRSAIAAVLGRESDAPITVAAMKALNGLDAREANISDLTGLEFATNLTWLLLASNSIADVSPLAGLTNLRNLDLSYNSIADVSPLSGLTNLTQLYLQGNPITDFSPLAGLTNLTQLDFVLEEEGTGEPVTIPDAHLRSAIAAVLGRESDAPITVAAMKALNGLDAREANISDLTGLEFATNLTWLLLASNSIADVSPLAGLTNLRVLDLSYNMIVDVSPLSGLTNLTQLFLHGNAIADVSPLAGLTNLTQLFLQGNPITDFSPLAGLTNLEQLDFVLVLEEEGTGEPVTIPDAHLRSAIAAALGRESDAPITVVAMKALNQLDAQEANISDLTGLEFATNLRYLDLRHNAIADVSPLSGLTNLTVLFLASNSIADVSPLSGLTNLRHLALSYNSITDVSPLSGLTNLTSLALHSNSITDVSPLSGLTNLTQLYLHGNSITNLSSLSGLTKLEQLDFVLVLEEEGTGEPVTIPDAHLRSAIAAALGRESDAPITVVAMKALNRLDAGEANISDLTGLEFATNLTSLGLWNNNITDVSPLSGLTKLEYLGLGDNSLTDVSPLSGLTNLEYLGLYRNNITDVSPLSGLTKLTQLFLQGNTITDVSPLAGLTSLTTLDIEGNSLTDVSPLSGLTNLTRLELQGNAITDVSPLSGLTNLTRLELQNNSLTDVSPLSGLTNLTTLFLQGNAITDFSPLAGLTNHLEDYDYDRYVLIPDANLRQAIAVTLGKEIDAPITVADMETLYELDAQAANISDLTGLEFASRRLTRLYLQGNSLTDVSPLAGLTRLYELYLQGNSLTDVSPLAGLTSLTEVYLQGNTITDVSPLAGLTSLTEVYLQGNTITDAASGLDTPRQAISPEQQDHGCVVAGGLDQPDTVISSGQHHYGCVAAFGLDQPEKSGS